jgi:hypothetical protein
MRPDEIAGRSRRLSKVRRIAVLHYRMIEVRAQLVILDFDRLLDLEPGLGHLGRVGGTGERRDEKTNCKRRGPDRHGNLPAKNAKRFYQNPIPQ